MLMVYNEAASFSASVSLQVDCTVGWHGRRIWFISCNITIWPDAGSREIRYVNFRMGALIWSAITLLSSSPFWSQMRLRSVLSLLFVVSHATDITGSVHVFCFSLGKTRFHAFSLSCKFCCPFCTKEFSHDQL